MYKKLKFLTLLLCLLAGFNAKAQTAPTYSIKQSGQADVTGNFTTWAAFMDVLNAHNLGTEDNRVTATISGATMSETGRPDIQGWTVGFLYNSDTFAYTTLIFDNCNFNFSRRSAFQKASHAGNILRFNNCTFSNSDLFWGVNDVGAATSYSYDFEFYNCDINNFGAGGCWFGDVTLENCNILKININGGWYDRIIDLRFKNSFGNPSTLTMKNVTFKNTEPGDMGVYANTFNKYVYQKASSDNHLYSLNGNGYYNQVSPFNWTILDRTGSCEYTPDHASMTAFYVLTGFAVKYDGNGGEGTVVDPNYYVPGEKATVLANGFTKSGYVFNGWNTKANGTGTSYAAGQEVEIAFYKLTLYAQWKEQLVCLWSEYVVACPETGYSETDGNATISSKEGLAWLISVVNGLNGQSGKDFEGQTVTLTQNVDMTDHIWEAIGTDAHPFKGTFTSNGSTINGLNNTADYGVAGLFGTVKGTVSNAFVESCNFVANPDEPNVEVYYGIIANSVNGGTVHSSEAMGTIEATNANAHIGGVVGKAEGSSEVHSVISYATLKGFDMGGIVNTLDGENAKLSNSYAKVTFTEQSREAGKDLAYSGSNIANCYYVQGTTQKMSDGATFTIPAAYNYGVSGCMAGTDRMVDKMNAWVNSSDKYAAWSQPTTDGINGDCPVLKLKDFNTMASNAATSPFLYYGDLDAQLSKDNILFYGQKDGSSAYSGTNLYIDQDAALKTTGTVKANVGVVSGSTYDWHMFSTPLTDAPLGIDYSEYEEAGSVYGTPSEVNFTADNGYFPEGSPYTQWDFYSFDESNSTWVNYKRYTGDHFDTYTCQHIPFANEENLKVGRGYLMAVNDMTYMQGYGTLNNAKFDAAVTCSGHHVTGCNFIGNPYHAYLDFEEFFNDNESNLASASYSVIADGSYATYAAGGSKNPSQASRYIHPHQGFIVKVNKAGTLTFAPSQAVVDQTSPYREAHVDYPLVNLFATDSEGIREIATAELGRPENGGALKIEGMQMGKCTMSVSNQGERYGIAFIEGSPEEVAVHFQATEDGDFTMKWNTHNGTFSYLHLIDNLTGMDIDCLSQSEYKFTARTGDYASRFKLKFEFTGVEENQDALAGSSSFAFFHQGNLVVNGQGSLELIDLNGRVLMTKNLGEGQSTVALPEVSKGLYLLRLADDSNVKTQKIIIK